MMVNTEEAGTVMTVPFDPVLPPLPSPERVYYTLVGEIQSPFAKPACVLAQTLNLNGYESTHKKKDSGVAIDDVLCQPFEKLSLGLPFKSPQAYQPKVTIHCVRHAQAEHNIRIPGRGQILDPKLTSHGRRQARYLVHSFPYMSKITHVVCSPMQRTLETALLGFKPIFDRGLKLVAWPDIREWGNKPCSTGTPLADLKRDHASETFIDLELVEEGWEVNKEGKCRHRAERVRKELFTLANHAVEEIQRASEQRDVHILVISHAGFLATLEGASDENLQNTECRSYNFAPGHLVRQGESPWWLVETQESKMRAHVPVPEEQVYLQLSEIDYPRKDELLERKGG